MWVQPEEFVLQCSALISRMFALKSSSHLHRAYLSFVAFFWTWTPVSMGSNGFQWVPMGSNGFQWVPMGSNRFQWVPMGSNRFQWVPMGSNFQWIPCIQEKLDNWIELVLQRAFLLSETPSQLSSKWGLFMDRGFRWDHNSSEKLGLGLSAWWFSWSKATQTAEEMASFSTLHLSNYLILSTAADRTRTTVSEKLARLKLWGPVIRPFPLVLKYLGKSWHIACAGHVGLSLPLSFSTDKGASYNNKRKQALNIIECFRGWLPEMLGCASEQSGVKFDPQRLLASFRVLQWICRYPLGHGMGLAGHWAPALSHLQTPQLLQFCFFV